MQLFSAKRPARSGLLVVILWLSASYLAAWAAGSTPQAKLRFEHLTNRDGLSGTTVFSILQDRQGFMWLGTSNGLNRYDGYSFRVFRPDPEDPDSLPPGPILILHEDRSGHLWSATWGQGLSRVDLAEERWAHYRHDPDNAHSLSDNDVFCLAEDQEGGLWIGTRQGLDLFDPGTDRFIHYRHDPDDPYSLSHQTVSAITEDRSGQLWIGTWGGGLNRFDRTARQFVHYRHDPHDPHSLSHEAVRAIFEDHSGVLWIATRGGGLNRFDPRNGGPAARRFKRYRHDPDDPYSLSHDMVRAIVEERPGVLWIATEGGGINRFDTVSGRFIRHRHDVRDPHSLSHDLLTSLYRDRAGIMWSGTRAHGINRFNPSGASFAHSRHDPDNPRSLREATIFAITEDRDGDLWIGTFGAGLSRSDSDSQSLATQGFTHYRHNPNDPRSLSSDIVFSVHEDRDENLWIGTENGLDQLPGRSTDGHFVHYRHDPDDPHSLSHNRVRGISQDRAGMLWIGTWGGGLNRLDPTSGHFTRYRHDPDDPHSLGSDIALAILEDRSGTLWVSTWNSGLNRFDGLRQASSGGHFVRYRHEAGNRRSLSHDNVSVLHEDSSGRLWIGTSGAGLNLFDPITESFTRFTEADGLSSNIVSGILEDDAGRLWLSTGRGLTRFDPVARRWASYDVRDGLQDDEFSHGAYFRSQDGTMYFGGTHGFNSFDPAVFQDDAHVPPIVLTSFKILEREADLGRSVPYLKSADLEYWQNFFSFEFAALSFARPDKSRYTYKLEGLDEDWIPAGDRRYSSYTSVPPGEYIFRVKGSNRDGLWNNQGSSLRIVVNPPPWKTWWAYTLYVIGLGTAVSGYFYWHRKQVEHERSINHKLMEIDRIKNEFLANTSHELRTPLHGIIGLAESLRDGVTGDLPRATKNNLEMIIASGQRLTGLVNDILDFTKMTHKNLELRRQPVDLSTLVEVVLAVSRPLIGPKALELKNAVDPDLPAADADENRLQQILLNLIGNAIKFTESGIVEIAAIVEADQLVVKVSDTGIGIENESLNRIFEAFEQADASTARSFGGTGLGLAVTRQLVQLHGGKIQVEATPGEGSTFSFTLPIASELDRFEARSSNEAFPKDREDTAPKLEALVERDVLPLRLAEDVASGCQARILIVDDEPVNLQVLVNHLSRLNFKLAEATGGPDALRLLAQQDFDLILLDVMMPKMSGYEVCRAIRERFSLHELPVIFLTAKNQTADLVTGLSVGGNDYLTKPIVKDELLARVHTQLDLLQINRNLKNLIEERTAQMAERERLIVELQSRNEELRRFNYMVSHDLKNPLVTIKNFLGVARKDAELGNRKLLGQDLGRIDAAASTMQSLLEDLHELSRLGELTDTLEAVTLYGLVHEATAFVSDTMAERGIELRISPMMPVVVGDRERLLELVQILLDNAVKFMGDQRAPLVEVGSSQRGGEEAVFIRDNGIGIDLPYHNKIFSLFERLSLEVDGTGVGLTLAKRIVEMHGGRIWVESEGRAAGSTFFFTLPKRGLEMVQSAEKPQSAVPSR